MNIRDPELVDRLASEYVLGTLHGKARQRLETLLIDRDDIRRAVWRWENRLADLSSTTPLLEPSKRVWTRIGDRLGFNDKKQSSGSTFWHLWSAAASLAAVVMAVLLITSTDSGLSPIPTTDNADHIAVVGEGNDPLWLISANLTSGALTARAINAQAAEVDKVFELWMLPTSGDPRSIGILPVSGNTVSHQIPPGLLALLKESKGLAISIEPIGGSPTGLPTGPVVHTATVVGL